MLKICSNQRFFDLKSSSTPLLIFARFWATQGFVKSRYKRTHVLILDHSQHLTFNKMLINHGADHIITTNKIFLKWVSLHLLLTYVFL